MSLKEKKTEHDRRTYRQILTAQDSHVQPGIDVGQLILQKETWKVLCVVVYDEFKWKLHVCTYNDAWGLTPNLNLNLH